ncbi:hypothetical protein HanIR_Chr02g0098681 [Helianthus annuus]|nr:hypothetical protein HanIR_Chr02g0098681 [Helianthus annuus]
MAFNTIKKSIDFRLAFFCFNPLVGVCIYDVSLMTKIFDFLSKNLYFYRLCLYFIIKFSLVKKLSQSTMLNNLPVPNKQD